MDKKYANFNQIKNNTATSLLRQAEADRAWINVASALRTLWKDRYLADVIFRCKVMLWNILAWNMCTFSVNLAMIDVIFLSRRAFEPHKKNKY